MDKQVITPDLWGPHGWKFLHYLSFGYPMDPTTEQKNQYKTFFLSLQHVLPCSICSKHYSDNLMEYSLDDALRNRDALVRWVIDIHNSVNEAQGKKIYEYDEAIRLYTTKDNSTVFTVVFIALLIFLIYYILKK
jgi:hypothetical protein